jgi:hypothetical protein
MEKEGVVVAKMTDLCNEVEHGAHCRCAGCTYAAA